MRIFRLPGVLALCVVAPAFAHHAASSFCGTTAETPMERVFLHRQALRHGAGIRPRLAARSVNRDAGNIAIIEDRDGVIARQNQFNLDQKTLLFTPSGANAARYAYSVAEGGYDAAAAAGTPLAALDDDDYRALDLPFPFPFFGATYNRVYVNSDGNLTFTAPEYASTTRSLGRMTSGPPRIAPLFDDLNPAETAGGVRVLANSQRVVVSWVAVPEWQATGIGAAQTFQVRLYPDGRIEFAYAGVAPSSAVAGIAPGNLKGSTSLVDFRNDPSASYSAAVAERFGNTLEVDIVTVAQQFYQAHDDAYDYLVIYNNMNVQAMNEGVIAYETTVRNRGAGFGVPVFDTGAQYGSPSRLQSVLNMGFIGGIQPQYPVDPNGTVPARAPQHDTPLTVLGHEAGHRFLAFASVAGTDDPSTRPMIGYGGSHWAFVFNSEASLDEGERISDLGTSASPRFLTTDVTQGYAPLDQYLMGFRPASDVPPTFVVTNTASYLPDLHPYSNVRFDGARRDVTAGDVVQAMGRRTPDWTVAQRHYRFAFILVVAQGADPSPADLAQVDAYRQQFETYYSKAASGNAFADTSLRRGLQLSLAPAAGVVAGATTNATLTLASPAAADVTAQIQAAAGYAQMPATVRIPAGTSAVTFPVTGLKPGVEEVAAAPSDPAYETAYARVQVADSTTLRLTAISTQPDAVVQLSDANNLEYAGVRLSATASAGSSVSPAFAITDAQGRAAFHWIPGGAPSNSIEIAVDAQPAVSATLHAGSAVPVISSVVNAASFAGGVAAGALQSILGANLAGGQTAAAAYPWPTTLANVQVLLNGKALPLLYVSDRQINFYVPPDASLGPGTIAVGSTAASVTVAAVQPGIFAGAVVGDYIEIYCTGLGPTKLANGFQQTASMPIVFVGAVPVQPVYSGLAPGLPGVYQVNAQIPKGLTPGLQPVLISVNLSHSNEIQITVQ
jgi:uncharacterized protein (TIGR03437 family)